MARQEMLEFVRSLFRGRPDLSTLTHNIVRRRFLAHAGRDHLETQEKQALKRLVEEELLKMQVEEVNTEDEDEEEEEAAAEEEKRDLAKKVKRPPTPCSNPERKRRRFNSESEPSSGASSPDDNHPLAKNRMATETSATEELPRRASKKTVESSDEEQQDVTAKTGSEGDVKESSEEEGKEEEGGEEGFVRTSKVLKLETREKEGEESSKGKMGRAVMRKEDEEDESSEGKVDGEGKRETKDRTRKQPGMRNKRVRGKTSARRKPAREVSEDSGEEEHIQRTGKKMGRKREAKSHQESEKEEENLVEEESRDEEDWKSGPRGNGRKGKACGERHCEQKSRARCLGSKVQDCGSEAGSGEEEPSMEKKGKDRSPREGGNRQSRSIAEDGDEDRDESSEKVKSTKDTGKPARVGRPSSGESDLEREVSDSESEGNLKGERKNRSSKNSKKGRTWNSSSSSSDGSPEHKGRKAGSGRCGEDHPAVMRLKRYIRACGAHRNYKKLLGSCNSRKERLSVLRAELEALGMKGNPSLEKCRALRERREEEAEVASLDVSNIINCSGRPRRRTAWNPSATAPTGELYRRALDSEEEQPRPPPPDWSHMRGIISSDGESN